MNEIKSRLTRVAGLGGKRKMQYEKAKKIASEGGKAARRKLAARVDAPPEVLYYLAEDTDPDVRRAIAENAATPPHADLLLARDIDEAVRCSLAEKIALLVPDLSEEAQERLRDLTLEVLEILVCDELPRIRAILAEALAEVTGAPPPEITRLVQKLARDTVLDVASPILEKSELLTDRDLLEIIQGAPIDGAISAIARRANVGEAVSDVIADGDDRTAIAALLANPSAQIREETLDRIVDRAPAIEEWHSPLVRRPKLSAQAARRIAGFVADTLLEVLKSRKDLDSETTRAVEEVVHRRLDDDVTKPSGGGDQAAPSAARAVSASVEDEPEERPIDRALKLHKKGELDEPMIARAMSSGNRGFVNAALAVLSGLPIDIVREIVSSESAKGVTSLAWKAGLGMRFAVELQMRHAGIQPKSVLYAKDGFDYPLSEEDMAWQIEFFGG